MDTKQLRRKTNISYVGWKDQTPKERKEWDKRVLKSEERWKNWLFEDEEVEDNPKRERCFGIAWEQGHSCGYEEVESYFREIVELIK